MLLVRPLRRRCCPFYSLPAPYRLACPTRRKTKLPLFRVQPPLPPPPRSSRVAEATAAATSRPMPHAATATTTATMHRPQAASNSNGRRRRAKQRQQQRHNSAADAPLSSFPLFPIPRLLTPSAASVVLSLHFVLSLSLTHSLSSSLCLGLSLSLSLLCLSVLLAPHPFVVPLVGLLRCRRRRVEFAFAPTGFFDDFDFGQSGLLLLLLDGEETILYFIRSG